MHGQRVHRTPQIGIRKEIPMHRSLQRCQGWGRGFESLRPLQSLRREIRALCMDNVFIERLRSESVKRFLCIGRCSVAKVGVEGSNPFARSKVFVEKSERYAWTTCSSNASDRNP